MMRRLPKARRIKLFTYRQVAKQNGGDYKLAKEYLKDIKTAIKLAAKEGKFETCPVIIICDEPTLAIIKSQVLSAGYFFDLQANNQVIKVYWE